MSSEPGTPTSRFQEQLARVESARDEVTRQQRVTFFALLPLTIAIAIALIIPYMQIVLTLQDADYYYILDRPDWPTYLRLAGPALFAGPIAAGIVVIVWSQLDDLLPTFGRMVVFGAAFGAIMPFLMGLLTPLNLFIIGVTGVSNVSGQGSVQQMIGDWVFSTPMFTFLFWADWLGPGIMLGALTGVLFWLIVRVAGPISDAKKWPQLIGSSLLAGAVILMLVTVWPFGLFSYMFETLQ